MRALLTMIAILVMGVASAQTYGPVNGKTFTVTGTTEPFELSIAGSSNDGHFVGLNLEILSNLPIFTLESLGGELTSQLELSGDEPSVSTSLFSLNADQIDSLIDGGTLIIYRNGQVEHESEIIFATSTSLELSQDESFTAMSGDIWKIIIG